MCIMCTYSHALLGLEHMLVIRKSCTILRTNVNRYISLMLATGNTIISQELIIVTFVTLIS